MSSSSARRGMSTVAIMGGTPWHGGLAVCTRNRSSRISAAGAGARGRRAGSAAETLAHVAGDLAQPLLERAQPVRLARALLLSRADEDQCAAGGAGHHPRRREPRPAARVAERA